MTGFDLPWWAIVAFIAAIIVIFITTVVFLFLGVLLIVGIFLAIFLPIHFKNKKNKEKK